MKQVGMGNVEKAQRQKETKKETKTERRIARKGGVDFGMTKRQIRERGKKAGNRGEKWKDNNQKEDEKQKEDGQEK